MEQGLEFIRTLNTLFERAITTYGLSALDEHLELLAVVRPSLIEMSFLVFHNSLILGVLLFLNHSS